MWDFISQAISVWYNVIVYCFITCIMVQGERQKNKRYRPGSRRQNWKNFDLCVFPGSPYQDSWYWLSQLILFSTAHNCQKERTTTTHPNIPNISCQIFTIFAKKEAAKHSKYFMSNIHHICQKIGSHEDPSKYLQHSKYFGSYIHHICQKGGSHDDPSPTAVWRRRKHNCFLCVVLGSSDIYLTWWWPFGFQFVWYFDIAVKTNETDDLMVTSPQSLLLSLFAASGETCPPPPPPLHPLHHLLVSASPRSHPSDSETQNIITQEITPIFLWNTKI